MFKQVWLAGLASATLAAATVPVAEAQEQVIEDRGVITDGLNEPIEELNPADPFGDIFGDVPVEELDPADQSLGENLSDVEKEQLRIRCAEITDPDPQTTYPTQAVGVCTALADQLEAPEEAAGEVEMQDVSPSN